MPALADLVRDLDRALAEGKEDRAVTVCVAIARAHPDTPAGAEARYRLGLYELYRAENLDAAAEHFRASAKTKQPTWSHTARTSLGLVLLRQGKHQQAVFELRRAAAVTPPNLLVAQACGMLVLALSESGNTKEAARARLKHLEVLDTLAKDKDPSTAAIARFTRGMEHKFDGEREPAKALLTAALEGEGLPVSDRAVAETALSKL